MGGSHPVLERIRRAFGRVTPPQPAEDTPELKRILAEGRESRLRGVVLVEFDVDAAGSVTRASAHRGPLNQLAWRTAERAVRAMAFRPAMRNGAAVVYKSAKIHVHFGPDYEMKTRGWLERLKRRRR
jgi:TonB family protein